MVYIKQCGSSLAAIPDKCKGLSWKLSYFGQLGRILVYLIYFQLLV